MSDQQKETAVGAAAKNEYQELVSKIESCVLESGLPFKKVLDALDAVRERQKCKGINFLNKVNIQEVQEESTVLI
ncbi:hypothetical protein D3C74_159920 [compost metagenome]